MTIETTYEGYLKAKKSGHLHNMKVSHRGAVSVDSSQLVHSTKVKSTVKELRKGMNREDSTSE